jgi:hypothetical protein
MAVFAVIAPELDPRLEPAIKEQFPERHYKIAPAQFLVADNRLTTQQVSTKLGASGGSVGRVMIVRFSSYAGWHSKDMWEWIAAQLQPSPPSLFEPDEPEP